MTKLFISYSRVDTPFVDDFIPRLSEKYEVWFDQGIIGGQIWWQEILDQIKQSDIFVYLLSNESVDSPFCQGEYEEAKRLEKQFLPVQVRARTEIPEEIKKFQVIDFSSGIRNNASWIKLDEAINFLASQIKKNAKPTDTKVTPLPDENRVRFTEAIQKISPNSTPSLFAQATDLLYKGVLDRSVSQLRNMLNLEKTESPRKYFGEYAVLYVGIAEKLSAEKLLEIQPQSNDDIIELISNIADQVGVQARITRDIIGYDLVIGKPL